MSTSILYHHFGIRGYRHERTDFIDGKMIFRISQDRDRLQCPTCDSYNVQTRGSKERTFRTNSTGRHPVEIVFAVPRVECRNCMDFRYVKIKFANPRKSYTKPFERQVLDLSLLMTIKDVALHLGVSWDLVKDIQKRNLKKRYAKPRLRDLEQIAIDEISIGKGHKYLTVVMDLQSGAVVFVGDGKGADALNPFWRRLKSSRAQIAAVAIDMSPAYTKAVKEHLPNAVLVYDHFHVVKLFNERLDNFRRKLYRDASQTTKGILKGIRFLLLKNPENLNQERDEEKRLQKALSINEPLNLVYYMKEELRYLWKQNSLRQASVLLEDWINRARASGVSMLKKFAATLEKHREGILAYYKYPISTGPLEGTNNKIKTLKRQAYGYRDMEFFKLKIKGIHESKHVLVGA